MNIRHNLNIKVILIFGIYSSLLLISPFVSMFIISQEINKTLNDFNLYGFRVERITLKEVLVEHPDWKIFKKYFVPIDRFEEFANSMKTTNEDVVISYDDGLKMLYFPVSQFRIWVCWQPSKQPNYF